VDQFIIMCQTHTLPQTILPWQDYDGFRLICPWTWHIISKMHKKALPRLLTVDKKAIFNKNLKTVLCLQSTSHPYTKRYSVFLILTQTPWNYWWQVTSGTKFISSFFKIYKLIQQFWRQRNRGLAPNRGKNPFSSSLHQDRVFVPPSFPFNGYRELYLEGKAIGTFSWPLASNNRLGEKCVGLYFHTTIRLHGMVLN
jgi:hypothetical protein